MGTDMSGKVSGTRMQEIKSQLKNNGRLVKSQIKDVPDLIWSLALISISSDKARLKEWFKSPVPALGGRSPISVINEEKDGEAKVCEMLWRIRGGIPCGD